MLDEIHKVFLQRILQVKTASIPLMYWDLKQLLMTNRVLKMKLLLLNHVALLDDKCIAKKVFEEEKENSFGLVGEVEDFLTSISISKNMIEKFSKKEWSKKISEAIDDKNKKELISRMKCQKKINIFFKVWGNRARPKYFYY